ncbi:MAG: transcriptional regulator [Paenibacillus sp.]|nr:transcriptional regulator [Paenibacillus sp.]
MNVELLNGFSPKLLDVVVRDAPYWHLSKYQLIKEYTKLHVLAYVYSGGGSLQLGDNKKWELTPGMFFQVWPGERMIIETKTKDPLCFYSAHYQYGVVHWEGVKGEWREASGPLPIGEVLTDAGGPIALGAFERLYRIWHDKQAGYEWDALVEFLGAVRQAVAGKGRKRAVEEAAGATAIREAVAYMKAHYQKELSRNVLAQQVALSPAYFSSLFKSHTGLTPIQYIHRLRLDRAKQLLREGGMPIRQVAEEVGFADSFYFTRLFTKETGLSPRDYRHA